eukprot:scaffold5443_cov291-Pinguiococcus_pyrenoidosus.AAC.5
MESPVYSQPATQTQVFSPEDELTQVYVESGDASGAAQSGEIEHPWARLVFAEDKRPPEKLYPRPKDKLGRLNAYVVGRPKKGRNVPDVVFSDQHVSSEHCIIYCLETGTLGVPDVYLEDRSQNGTYINDNERRIGKGKRRLLHNGDEVHLVRPSVPGRAGASAEQVERTTFTFIANFSRQNSAGNSAESDYDDDGGATEGSEGPRRRRLQHEYEIHREIGRGTAGVVHLGVHKKSGDEVAIKVIGVKRFRFSSAGHVSVKELTEEARLLQQLRHTGIISVKDVFCDEADEPNGAVYVVMELVKGGDLFDRILARGVYDEDTAKELMKRVLEAVQYLHEQNIVHRDLKPENILLVNSDDDVECKITDFGLAKQTSEDGLKTFCGTPAYFAPEVLKRRMTIAGTGRYGKEADMWSLGVIMYILLSGRQPFNDSTLFDQIETAAYRLDGKLWDSISEKAKDLLRGLLNAAPERRLTAQDALAHAWFEDKPTGHPQALEPKSSPTSERRKRSQQTSQDQVHGKRKSVDESDDQRHEKWLGNPKEGLSQRKESSTGRHGGKRQRTILELFAKK